MNMFTGCPPPNATTVGIPWLCTACNNALPTALASTSSLARRNAPWRSAATFSRIGPSVRHGAHHEAHMSTTTGRCIEPSITTCSKSASVTSSTVVAVLGLLMSTMLLSLSHAHGCDGRAA